MGFSLPEVCTRPCQLLHPSAQIVFKDRRSERQLCHGLLTPPNRAHDPASHSTLLHPPSQIVFKNLRIMNGNSKMGFGGAVEVSGPVDLTFINCEFGGSVSEFYWSNWRVLGWS